MSEKQRATWRRRADAAHTLALGAKSEEERRYWHRVGDVYEERLGGEPQ